MAVAYCKLDTGSTTYTLTALTSCIASNPSGTITRINKTAHGLTTGQLVSLTLFSTWLNRVWSVSVVDADNFDLVEAVWQTTADNNGTVTPYNGYSWATAIKEPLGLFNSIGGNAKPDVEVRMEKSPNPYSIGNATWTDGSGLVTLATAQTKTIDNCEIAWTAANSATVTRVTTSPVKQGTYRMQIAVPAVPVINTKYAYYDLGSSQDFSAYQRISYWLAPSSTSAIDADTEYKICLCSDATGDTIVDEFILPRQNYSTETMAFTVTRNGGGNLGNSIRSVALYTSTTTPTGSTNIILDNIFACTSTGLNLMSVISKCNVATYDHTQEPWFGVESIDGTTVYLASPTQTDNWNQTNNTYFKYTTEGTSPATVATYARESLLIDTKAGSGFSNVSYATPQALDNWFIVDGGWNSSNTTQDGLTFSWLRASYLAQRYVLNNGSSSETSYPRNVLLKNLGFVNWNGLMNMNTAYQRSLYFENIYGVRFWTYVFDSSGMLFDGKFENCSFTAAGTSQPNFFIQNAYINNFKFINLYRITMRIKNGTVKNIFISGGQPGNSAMTRLQLIDCVTENISIYGNSSVPADNSFVGTTVTSPANLVNRINGLKVRKYTNAISFNGDGTTILDNPTFSNNTNTFWSDVGSSQNTIITNNMTRSDTNLVNFSTNPFSSFQPVITLINNALAGNKDTINHYYKFLNRTTGLANNAWGVTVSAQTAVRHTASGIAWQINPLNVNITETYPFNFKIASVAVNASSTVTVKAWMKLSSATDIGAKLYIPGAQISGPTNATSATKSADTNWEELTVTFTPTVQGVVDIYAQVYWKASVADESVYVDDITVAQA